MSKRLCKPPSFPKVRNYLGSDISVLEAGTLECRAAVDLVLAPGGLSVRSLFQSSAVQDHGGGRDGAGTDAGSDGSPEGGQVEALEKVHYG